MPGEPGPQHTHLSSPLLTPASSGLALSLAWGSSKCWETWLQQSHLCPQGCGPGITVKGVKKKGVKKNTRFQVHACRFRAEHTVVSAEKSASSYVCWQGCVRMSWWASRSCHHFCFKNKMAKSTLRHSGNSAIRRWVILHQWDRSVSVSIPWGYKNDNYHNIDGWVQFGCSQGFHVLSWMRSLCRVPLHRWCSALLQAPIPLLQWPRYQKQNKPALAVSETQPWYKYLCFSPL